MESNKYFIRSLNPKDLNEMYFSFLNAFEDYPVPFKLTKEQFVRKFVEKLKIDFPLSIGAFEYNAMAGFIFTSVNHYKGKLTAYNGGTGVKKPYRGNRLTKKMYDFLLPKFQQRGIKQCVLEVLTNNKTAIKVYESIGFTKQDLYCCFILKKELKIENNDIANFEILKIIQPDWDRYKDFQDFKPTFLDSNGMITENLANEEILEARVNGVAAAYAIYQPAFGRLSQLAVNPAMRRSGIATALISFIYNNSHNKNLTVINVNQNDKGMINLLTHLGFENQLNQYEMLLEV